MKTNVGVCVCVCVRERERERDTSNMLGSLATAVRSAPTKESPAPVVSTTLAENPVTLPLKFYSKPKHPKV